LKVVNHDLDADLPSLCAGTTNGGVDGVGLRKSGERLHHGREQGGG
jgi:hypothetical protein